MMGRKLLFLSISLLAVSSLWAKSDYDLSLKLGVTSLENEDKMNFEDITLGFDASFNVGYYIKPRLDITHVHIDDEKKWGGVSSLTQIALGGEYGQAFDMVSFRHEAYIYMSLGYEIVSGGYKKFDSLPFFQGGVGLKYGVSEALNILTEFRAIQVFDGNSVSGDEENEFTVFVGVSFPLMQKKSSRLTSAQTATQMTQFPKIASTKEMPEKVTSSVSASDVVILLDSDDDGVTDDIDICQKTKLGTIVNASGCDVLTHPDIEFESNSAIIKADSIKKIVQFATYFNSLPKGSIVTINGYTDSSGDADTNKRLSSKRAFAVRKVLIAAGAKKSLVRAYGLGDINPIADNETEEGRAKNRRIELVITKKEIDHESTKK